MSAHTPGPWSVESADTAGHVLVVDEQDVSVCRVYQQPHDTWRATDTAALIAAAPDLLAALREIAGAAHIVGVDDECNGALDAIRATARAAIAKAVQS